MGLVTQWAARQLIPDSALIESLLVKAATFIALAIFAAILVAGLGAMALYGLYQTIQAHGMEAGAALWVTAGFGLCILFGTLLVADRVRAECMLNIAKLKPVPINPQAIDFVMPVLDAFMDGFMSPGKATATQNPKTTPTTSKVVNLKHSQTPPRPSR